MYKCRVCKKIYPNRVQYCDCGSDDFEVIVQQAKSAPKTVNKKETLSWVIFWMCVSAAVLVWFI